MTWGEGLKSNQKETGRSKRFPLKKHKSSNNIIIWTVTIIVFIYLISAVLPIYFSYAMREKALGKLKDASRLSDTHHDISINNHYPIESERKTFYTAAPDRKRNRLGYHRQPEYPPIALKNGYEGFVTYQIDLNQLGVIENIKLAKTSGCESLDTAALKAVRGSAYTAPDILSPEPSRLVITCGFQNRLAQCLY